MVKVKECLQARHGFETQEECQWTLVPPTNVNGFVSGKIWAIARVGDTSDVRKVEKQQLHTLSSDEARAKYSDIAGSLAANKLRHAHQHQNRGLGVTKAPHIDATMDCMENGGVFNTRYDKWFDTAANMLQDDGSRIVCRLKQTCTPTGVDRKWVTTVTDMRVNTPSHTHSRTYTHTISLTHTRARHRPVCLCLRVCECSHTCMRICVQICACVYACVCACVCMYNEWKVNPGSPDPLFSKHSIYIFDTGETQEIISCAGRQWLEIHHIVSCGKECSGARDEGIYEWVLNQWGDCLLLTLDTLF